MSGISDIGSNFDRKYQRVFLLRLTLVLFTLYTVYSWVLAPLSVILGTDYIYSSTLLPAVLYYMYSAVEIFAFLCAYASFIFALLMLDKRCVLGSFAVYCGAVLYKYLSNLVATWIFDGAVDLSKDILLTPIISFLLEIAQLAAVCAVSAVLIKKFRKKLEVSRAAVAKLDEKARKKVVIFGGADGYSSLFSYSENRSKNPVFMSAFYAGCIVFSVKVVLCIIDAVSFYVYTRYFDFLQILIYVVKWAAISTVCVVVMLFILKWIYRNYKRSQN